MADLDPVVVVRELMGINKVVIHEQYRVPMSFHRITRVEHDLTQDKTFIVFDNFYNRQTAESGGLAMSQNSILLDSATLADEATLLQFVIDMPDTIMSGGTIEREGTE